MSDPPASPNPPPPPEQAGRQSTHPAARTKARRAAGIVSAAIILFYAGFFRWAFAQPWLGDSGGVVSLSFIVSVPFACGALSVAIGRWLGSDDWFKHAMMVPLTTLALGLLLCLMLGIEAAICIVMAIPLLLIAVVLGGLMAHSLLPRNFPFPRLQVTLLVFLPLITAMLEGTLHWPSEKKAITNSIVINASAETIWPLIASVDPIDPSQIPNRWIYRIGFPKPIAATLDHHRAGGVRIATFDRGVSFFETVTEWDPPRRLSFTIHADPDFIPHTAFDQHIIVGGRFYDVLDGTYEIEVLGPGRCRLHLTSNHRLSTRFNAYAAWWSVRIMDQIQGSILEVIRDRAESTE
jgi:hypothetical protein